MTAEHADEASICIGCGLCCDGTLHARATVKPGDELTVAAAGLEIAEEKGKRFFRQPCPHFLSGACTIYERRPGVCRTYRCALLTSLEAARTTRTEALDRIATAKKLIAAVRAIDPTAIVPADRSALADRLRAQLASVANSEREPVAKAILDIAMLEHFLNRWFLKEKGEEDPELAEGQS